MAYLWSKNIGRAILDFSRCIEINPNDAYCYHERGIAYHHLNAKESALADFDRASQIDPEWELPKRAREQLILGRRENEKI